MTFRRFGHVGLAVGTSLAALVNAGMLVFAFEKQIGGFVSRELLVPFVKILIAAGVMAAAVWATTSRLELLPGAGTVDAAIKALVPIVVGVGVYFIAARALRCRRRRRCSSVSLWPIATPHARGLDLASRRLVRYVLFPARRLHSISSGSRRAGKSPARQQPG